MHNFATALKALSVAVASTCMLACSNGTSRSSSNQFVATDQPKKETIKIDELNLEPIDIVDSNLYSSASLTLKALLFTDSTASVLDYSANVTRDNTSLLNTSTGITISIDPIPCGEGGYVSLEGKASDQDDDQLPFNFENALAINVATHFDQCAQAGNRLNGDLDVFLNLNLTELLNSVRYTFSADMAVHDVYLEQPNLDPVTITGNYNYHVESIDGVNVKTEVITDDTMLANDIDYQLLSYALEKQVNNETQAYSYEITSKFSASFMGDDFVEYQTITPLSGTGNAYPSSGKLMVFGKNSLMYITAMPNNMVKIELDEGNNGSIEYTDYASWDELVLDPTVAPSL